jgi:predicted MFS family arabinose efflux permease
MTATCGMAQRYAHLFLSRIGVGVGEAALVPPAHALLADYFPPKRRATAMAVFSMGIHVGVAFGFLLGGLMAQAFGWRRAFFAVGLPGLVLAVLVRLTVREPPRGHAEGLDVAHAAIPAREVVAHLWRRRSFRHLAIAAALHSFGGYAFAAWGPPFFFRVHHLTPIQIGLWLGIVLGVGGACGSVSGGVLADRLGARDARRQLYLPAGAALMQIPFVVGVLTTAAPVPSMLYLIPSAFLSAAWFGPVFALTQGLAEPRMRATAAAILVFIINLIGLGLGPLAVGMVSDALRPSMGAEALRWALLLIAVGNVWAAAHFLAASRTIRADLVGGATA